MVMRNIKARKIFERKASETFCMSFLPLILECTAVLMGLEKYLNSKQERKLFFTSFLPLVRERTEVLISWLKHWKACSGHEKGFAWTLLHVAFVASVVFAVSAALACVASNLLAYSTADAAGS